MRRAEALRSAALAILLAVPTPALADGVRGTPTFIDLETVVNESDVIVTGKVLKTAHKMATRNRRRYTKTFRLLLKVDQVLKGKTSLEFDLGTLKTFWVVAENERVPGRWAAAGDVHGADPASVKAGQRVVVYLYSSHFEGMAKKHPRTELTYLDTAAAIPAVKAVMAAKARAELIKHRQGTKCPIDRFELNGKCHAPSALIAAHSCGTEDPKSTARPSGELDIWCGAKGKRHGLWRTWSRWGGLLEQTAYRAGKRHGGWTRFFSTGGKHREGSYVAGQRDGEWKQWTKDGRLLGSFTMTRGTGVMTTWHDNGKKADEQPMKAGKAVGLWRQWLTSGQLSREQETKNGKWHGKHRAWDTKGVLSIKGRFRNGKEHGKWTNYENGKLSIVTCYKNGRELWDSHMTEGKTPKSRCP